MNKFEFTQENLKTQNYWISHANSIASILFAFNGLVIFWVASRIFELPTVYFWQNILILGFIALSFSTLMLLISVIVPRLGSKTTSLIYFGGIVKHNKEEFISRMNTLSEKEGEEMLIDQIYQNAIIAQKKFTLIKYASKLLIANIIVSTALVVSLYYF